MTPAERAARAHRIKATHDEYYAPLIKEMRETYTARIVEIANDKHLIGTPEAARKQTALSYAIRILEQIDNGIQAIILDGEVANRDLIRAAKIEDMTAPQRRLLGMAPGWGRG